jgi:hypothetical protein
MTAESIAKALGGHKADAGWMARCPPMRTARRDAGWLLSARSNAMRLPTAFIRRQSAASRRASSNPSGLGGACSWPWSNHDQKSKSPSEIPPDGPISLSAATELSIAVRTAQ